MFLFLKILCYIFKFSNPLFLICVFINQRVFNAVFYMILHVDMFCIGNSTGNGLELLGYIKAGAFLLNHLDDFFEMTLGTLQAFYNIAV